MPSSVDANVHQVGTRVPIALRAQAAYDSASDMIVRPRLGWLRMLFVWRGSVLKAVSPQLGLVLLMASVITWRKGTMFGVHVPLTIAPFTLLGVSLAVFLGFRNSASYDRFWEGRKLWGAVLIVTRSLVRQGLSLGNLEEADPRMGNWVALLSAFTHALRHQLRQTDPRPDLERLLPAAQSDVLLKSQGRPSRVLAMLGKWVQARKNDGLYGEITAVALDENLSRLSEVLGGCERLSNTPLPYPYSLMIHRTVYVYCFLLPFGLVDTIGVMTPVIAVLTAYTFMALEALAGELEEPFGTSENDLALDTLSRGIENSMLELIGKPAVAPTEALHFVLL